MTRTEFIMKLGSLFTPPNETEYEMLSNWLETNNVDSNNLPGLLGNICELHEYNGFPKIALIKRAWKNTDKIALTYSANSSYWTQKETENWTAEKIILKFREIRGRQKIGITNGGLSNNDIDFLNIWSDLQGAYVALQQQGREDRDCWPYLEKVRDAVLRGERVNLQCIQTPVQPERTSAETPTLFADCVSLK